MTADGSHLASSAVSALFNEDQSRMFSSKTNLLNRSLLNAAAGVVFLLALCLLVWGVAPLPRQAQRLDFPTEDLPASLQPLLQGGVGRLSISSPIIMRPGDPAEIELIFTAGGAQPARSRSGSSAYQAFARLEVLGAQLHSPPEILQALIPGETITTSWKLTAPGGSPIQARVWFGIVVLPAGAGQGVQELLAAPTIEINRSGYWLPTGPAARIAGLGLWVVILAAIGLSKRRGK